MNIQTIRARGDVKLREVLGGTLPGLWLSSCVAKPSTPGDGEYCFLDLCGGVVFGLTEFDVREVGQFVSCDDTIDDHRAVDLECLVDCRAQFLRLRCSKAMASASLCQRRKIWIGKFDAFHVCWHTGAFRFEHNQPEFRIVVNHDLDGQLVVHGGEELAHQHVE